MIPSKLTLSLIALASVVVLTPGCHKAKEAPPSAAALPMATVKVMKVEAKSHLATEEVVGTVRAKLRASIEAKVSGRIERMLVVAGQSVKSGELLAQLDVREVQARLEQARALREQAQRDLDRYKNLLKQTAVTQQEYDAMEARFRVADASVTEAETLLSYARIAAPFEGVISRKLADVGDLATPGRPLLELEDPKSLRMEADVPEALIGRVPMGTKLAVRASNLPGDLEGVVSEVAPVADPNSRTVRVKLDLPAASGLRLGQFGRVAVPVSESALPRVPAAAVVVRGQMEMVFVVTNQAAQLRLVKTGKRVGQEIELLSGISAGEQVVVDGAASLLDGQPVKMQ